MIINAPRIENRGEKTRCTAIIQSDTQIIPLWFEVDSQHADSLVEDRVDAFVVACLFPAIAAGKNIEAKGLMSPKLHYHINNHLVPILQLYLGANSRIAVISDRLEALSLPIGTAVMTGFSGGVDSFSNFYDHSGGRVSKHWQVTHFVYNNVGSHGQFSSAEDEQTFKKRYSVLQQFTEESGIDIIAVNSNMDDLIRLPFERTHTLRNASVALLLQKQVAKFLYASAFDYAHTKIGQCPTLGYLDPVILPLLSTERLECVPNGGQHTRVEKTRHVCEIRASRDLLDVCVRPDKAPSGKINCSSCWKCLRTAITLSALGKLDEYHRVFDIKTVRLFEGIFLLDAFTSRDPLQQEVAQLINAASYPVPLSTRIILAICHRNLVRKIAAYLWPRMLERPRFAKLMSSIVGRKP